MRLSINPTLLNKRYSGYQQAITISISLSLKRTILLFLLCVNFSLYSQEDSLTFVQYRFDNGQISSEGYLREGLPDGYWKSYYVTGNLKAEGNRENHQLSGPWKFYDENGLLTTIIRYENGKKNGLREQFLDSVLIKQEPYLNDVVEGTVRHFYGNGDIHKWIPFVRGREEGIGYEFDTAGTVISVLTYHNGVLVKDQHVNRKDRFGLKSGLWLEFYRSMGVRVEGTYKDDLKHGFWKYYQQNGNLIRIEKWVMGVLQEDEDNTSKIQLVREIDPNTGHIASIGAYQNGEKNGVFRQFDEEGNVTSAQLYQHGILLAEGKYDERGRKQGIWKYFWPDGTLKATGNYINDAKDGPWKYYFEDGSLEQEGVYVYDQQDGVWRWYFVDGELRLEQEFLEGLENGPRTEYNDSNMVIVKGQYIDGMRVGTWVYENHGVIETGEFQQDQRTGEWITKWTDINKVRTRGEWQNGQRVGVHLWYYKNGQIERRGKYENGLQEGVWEYFAINGARIVTVTYEQGEEVKYNRTTLNNDGRR